MAISQPKLDLASIVNVEVIRSAYQSSQSRWKAHMTGDGQEVEIVLFGLRYQKVE